MTMTTLRTSLIAALVLVASASLFSPSAEGKRRKSRSKAASPEVTTLADGMTLVTMRVKGATTNSLRLVIRGGALDERADRSGLAHVLEHMIFHGSYTIPEQEIFDDAIATGAVINAWTSLEWTTYVLDAPRAEFPALAGKYLRMVTNPALRIGDLEREKNVVEAEHIWHGNLSLLWATDQLVFPADNRGRSVIGVEKTRRPISADELASFYRRHYRPGNTVAIVTGDVSTEEARVLVESNVLWPPLPKEEEALQNDPPSPNVPSEAKALSPVTATASGYILDERDVGICDDIATLLDLRLYERVFIDDPITRSSRVVCYQNRGHTMVVALAFATNLLGSTLPDTMAEVFEQAHQKPITPAERRAVLERRKAELDLLRKDETALANALMMAVGNRTGTVQENLARLFRAPALNEAEMQKAMKASFKPKKRFLVHFSPFED